LLHTSSFFLRTTGVNGGASPCYPFRAESLIRRSYRTAALSDPRGADGRGMANTHSPLSPAIKETRMKATRTRRRALLISAVLAVVLSIGGYAFTASNTVPNAYLGQGANVISGYAISSITYNQNASNPCNIDSVAYTITPAAAGTVSVQLVSGGSWYSCTNTSGSVSCATTSPQATASAASSLNVVAGS